MSYSPVTLSSPNLATEKMAAKLKRNAEAVSLRPGVGQGTATTKVVLGNDLRCEVEDGDWKLTVGASEKSGGDNAGPNPGVLGRAALGTCMMMAYTGWLARKGIPVRGMTIEIEADYDVRGEIVEGTDVSPAYSEVRCVVTIDSEAPEREICEVLRDADERCSWLQMARGPIRVCRETWFAAPAADGSVAAPEQGKEC
jgi:uncharacterized OsmC-like protein